jgi:hypothetical protein
MKAPQTRPGLPQHPAAAMQLSERRVGPSRQPLWIVGLAFVVICLAFLGFRLAG